MNSKKLYRSSKNRLISGVFGELGNILMLTRRCCAWDGLITVFTGFIPGLIAYILAIIVIPEQTAKS